MKSYNKTLREFFKDFEIKCKSPKDYEHSLSAVTEVRTAEIYLRNERIMTHATAHLMARGYLDAKVKGYTEKTCCFGAVNPSDPVYSYRFFKIYLDDETSEEDFEDPWRFPTDDDDDDFIGCD